MHLSDNFLKTDFKDNFPLTSIKRFCLSGLYPCGIWDCAGNPSCVSGDSVQETAGEERETDQTG